MTAPKRLAVAAPVVAAHPGLRAEIEKGFGNVRFNDTGRRLEGGELAQFLTGCDAAIVSLERIDDALLAAAPSLRTISKYGVGLDRVDLDAMTRRGIRIGWTGGANARSVAELALALILACLRFLPQASADLREGRWTPRRGRTLDGRTVGLVGCGHIGQSLGRMLRLLGNRVLAYDQRQLPEFCAETGVGQVDLEALLAEADIVSLHLPETPHTTGVIDAARIGRMKPGAILINTARGGLVDMEALKQALREQRLAGAAFDTFDPEPPTDKELLALPGFIATPHIGGSTVEAAMACGRAAIAGLSEARLPAEIVPSWNWR